MNKKEIMKELTDEFANNLSNVKSTEDIDVAIKNIISKSFDAGYEHCKAKQELNNIYGEEGLKSLKLAKLAADTMIEKLKSENEALKKQLDTANETCRKCWVKKDKTNEKKKDKALSIEDIYQMFHNLVTDDIVLKVVDDKPVIHVNRYIIDCTACSLSDIIDMLGGNDDAE